MYVYTYIIDVKFKRSDYLDIEVKSSQFTTMTRRRNYRSKIKRI